MRFPQNEANSVAQGKRKLTVEGGQLRSDERKRITRGRGERGRRAEKTVEFQNGNCWAAPGNF